MTYPKEWLHIYCTFIHRQNLLYINQSHIHEPLPVSMIYGN